MKLTKNLITREEALQRVPDYVAYVEDFGNHELFQKMEAAFSTLKRGQKAITYHAGQYVAVKISSVNHNDYRAIDGPVVRVSNGEFSWRVDGDEYAAPVS